MNKIKKCPCSAYTLKGECPDCGSKTSSAHPIKFSPEDKYGKYRRISQQSNGNP